MAIRTTTLIRCDHIHEHDGKQCGVERLQESIAPTEPMYKVSITIDVVDASGAHQLVKEEVHLCYWCLYYHLSNYHAQAQIDVGSRKAELARHEEALNNDD